MSHLVKSLLNGKRLKKRTCDSQEQSWGIQWNSRKAVITLQRDITQWIKYCYTNLLKNKRINVEKPPMSQLVRSRINTKGLRKYK